MTRTYGQLTKKYREENDISIRKFAKMIGVGKSYLAKLETEGCTSTPTLAHPAPRPRKSWKWTRQLS